MKFKKVLTSSLLCAVLFISFKNENVSAKEKKEILPIHTISTDELNEDNLNNVTVSYINSTFDESEFSLVTEEDTALPDDMSLNMFYTNSDVELEIKDDNNEESKIIIPKGSVIEAEILGNEFSKIKFENKTGIVKASALTKNKVIKEEKQKDDSNTAEKNEISNKKDEEKTVEVVKENEEKKETPKEEKENVSLYATDILNVRENTSITSNRIGSLSKGDKISGFYDGEWFCFDFNGKKAYVLAKFLSNDKPVIEAPKEEVNKEEKQELKKEETIQKTDSSVVEMVVNAALSQVGKPYVWASSNPNVGFDCSGLTSYAFKQAGINLNRIASDQYSNGVAVSKDNLMRGDLVFFSYGGGINHVGIYIGNGKFVHASTYDTGVIVSSLSGYYLNVYAGAVRVIK